MNKIFSGTDLDWFEDRVGPRLPRHDLPQKPKTASVPGRLSCSIEGAGKRRVFAIVVIISLWHWSDGVNSTRQPRRSLIQRHSSSPQRLPDHPEFRRGFTHAQKLVDCRPDTRRKAATGGTSGFAYIPWGWSNQFDKLLVTPIPMLFHTLAHCRVPRNLI